jgi:hypothetical protein
MRVLLYAQADVESSDSLEKLVKIAFPEGKIEIFRSIEGLSRRLRDPLDNRAVAILRPNSREDLSSIHSIQHLLRDIQIVLLAPDSSPETMAMAHQLRPRFLTYINSDFEELSAVLRKMQRIPRRNDEGTDWGPGKRGQKKGQRFPFKHSNA